MTEPWRLRCPKGHSSITSRAERYYCESCDRSYYGEPYDAKRTEFPVDEEPTPKTDHEEVLAQLVQKCQQPTIEWSRARQLGLGRPKQVGQLLLALEDDGLVERFGSGAKNGHLWRPTDEGITSVIESERDVALEKRPQRQRAEVTPATHGLATLFVALVLLAGYAIATGGVAL